MAYRMKISPQQDRATQKLFGTDGIRGVANVYPMTAEIAMGVGRALAYLIRNGNHRHRVQAREVGGIENDRPLTLVARLLQHPLRLVEVARRGNRSSSS